MSALLNINFFGYVSLDTGLGEAARNNILALKQIGYVIDTYDVANSNETAIQVSKKGINIIQINPDNLYDFFLKFDVQLLKESYNVAFWAWESEDFPQEYAKFFSYFDEVWTPSAYCQKVIAKKSHIPVLCMPHAVVLEKSSANFSEVRKTILGNREHTFMFSFFFDYKSQIVRKNILGLIRSFRLAFGDMNEHVTLLLKTFPSKHHLDDRASILAEIGEDKSIILFEEHLERNVLHHLLQATDCYISLHHAEGFGLTMAEAMALGKPVIATAYSGNMEYMNANNALLVDFNMISLDKSVGPFLEGTRWAKPDEAHAAQCMVKVFSDSHFYETIAENAQRDITQSLNFRTVGNLMGDRIRVIEQFRENIKPSELVVDICRLELENELLKLKLTKIKSLTFIKLKLKIKEYQNRKSGKNKKYAWE